MRNFELCNAVRLGISLYGYYPSAYVKEKVETELQPSAQLLTQVVQTKYLKVGESVSYGSTFTATEDIKSQFCQLICRWLLTLNARGIC